MSRGVAEGRRLGRRFFARPPEAVAVAMLGKLLLRRTGGELLAARIVETEAYLSRRDAACHGHARKTVRNASMFGPAGHAYVYAIHARFCFNAVTERAGLASAVLVRAAEPVAGLDAMRQRRGTGVVRDLARGPARLCEALGITRRDDGLDLTAAGDLWVADDGRRVGPEAVVATPRVGLSRAQDLRLRFLIAECPFVSGPAKRNAPGFGSNVRLADWGEPTDGARSPHPST